MRPYLFPPAARALKNHLAHDRLEVAREVGLVGVPERRGEAHERSPRRAPELIGSLVEAVAANGPLWRDADVPREEALKRSQSDTQRSRAILGAQERAVGGHPFAQVACADRVVRERAGDRAEDRFGRGDPPV